MNILQNMIDLNPFKETLHGHRKRLIFFLDQLRDYCLEIGVSASDVTILDIGCGNGQQVATPVGRAGYHVTGIDIHHSRYAACSPSCVT